MSLPSGTLSRHFEIILVVFSLHFRISEKCCRLAPVASFCFLLPRRDPPPFLEEHDFLVGSGFFFAVSLTVVG